MSALLTGTLSVEARAEVANHAATCAACHVLIDSLVDAGSGGREPTIDAHAQPAEPFELRRGSRVGRYLIEERLGAGGMGVVYSALDSELERRVAVKLLSMAHDGAGSIGRERLMREARTLARLSHPNVVTVFDVGAYGDRRFVAMELVDGGSLTAWLARSPRSTDDILGRMIEAGRGLAAAHSAGVVHRDVKPDNILVGLDGRARVTDFGLARIGDAPIETHPADVSSRDASLTRTGTLMGTPAYMAPEQKLRAETSVLTDQWSFCATVYEALAGVRPFAVDDRDARSAGRFEAPARGRRVPAWVRQIISRGLQLEPDARWPSMDALVAALAGHRRRRRNLAVAAAALALVGVAVAGSLLVRPRAAPPPTPSFLPNTLTWVDPRPGCSCPFSTCEKRCDSICRASSFKEGAKPAGISEDRRQEILLGVSGDGNTLLYLTGPGCSRDRLTLARRRGDTFDIVDITDRVDRQRFAIFEGCCTLSADGATVLLSNLTRTGFAEARLVGDQLISSDGDFGQFLPDDASTLKVRHPVLAADGLSLYFRLDQPVGEPGDVGPFDGHYVVERPDRAAPFAKPRKLGRLRIYDYATGISSDGLSLFVAAGFETYVLVRSSTSKPFGDPDGITPARIRGWRAIPLADCGRLITTTTPGGCAGEDITYLDAVFTP